MILQWGKCSNYQDGFYIGSCREDGSHSRSERHWPYSIYRQARQDGTTDIVLCHGIQSHDDAAALCRLLNEQYGN